MAILQVLGTDKALRLNDFNLLNLVGSFDWAPNFNAQDIFELGTTTKLDTAMELETGGSFELSSIGNTAGLLARMQVVRNASGHFTGYKYNSGGAGGKNAYVFTQDDLSEMKFDVILHEKTDQKTFNRSTVLPCAYLTSLGGRAEANGMASETFNFAGSVVFGFPGPNFHDVRSVPATETTSTTCTLLDTGVSSTTHTLAWLFVDGEAITSDSAAPSGTPFATLGASGVVTVTPNGSGYAIPDGAHCQAIVYKTTPGTTFPTTGSVERFAQGTDIINYVKGYQANIYIAPANAAAPTLSERWLRVQSIDWNVDLRVETLRQVLENKTGSSIYGRPPTFPLDCTMNISVTESDWADWKAIMTGKSFVGANVHQNTFEFAPKYLKNEFAVVVNYYTKNSTLIQNWRWLDARVDGFGLRTSVGGRGEVSWTFKATEFRIEGFNP